MINPVKPNYDTELFYAELPKLHNFIDITDSRNFVSVPDDWFIVITDIVDSTIAIEAGLYKEINLLGASCIVAILNLAKDLDIPFVFGGDGASTLIPPSLVEEAKSVMIDMQEFAKQLFELEIRVGIIPVAVVKANYELKIAKLEISENYSQAILKGGGITYATHLVKDAATNHLYQPQGKNPQQQANCSGLECRWRSIPSRHGEIVSLIVMATAPNETQTDSIYREAIAQIQKHYGNDRNLHPVVPENLNLAFRASSLLPETKVFTQSKTWLHKLFYLWKARLENLLGVILIKFKVKSQDMDWGEYKKTVIDATDYKKFDDALRMVISGNESQRKKLISFLEKKYQQGRLVYGYHVSEQALMTCLVFERNGRQVHFIDGADGGYAIAAKHMKQRMKA
jgi:hypothetical protein